MARQDLEALFLAHLPTIEKILSALGRRGGLSPDATEEFASWAKMRLIENEYAILGKWRGESSLPTYLTVVLAMLSREYRVQQWGRWRPSAAAKRGGSIAIRLETLMNRDNMPLGQAGHVLRTSGETTLGDRALAAIAAEFPMRSPLRPVQVGEPVTDPVSPTQADDLVAADEADAESAAARHALDEALNSLPTEDRLIVKLRFMEAMSVADISRALALPQAPIYKRLERTLSGLRTRLERAGVSRDLIRELATGSE